MDLRSYYDDELHQHEEVLRKTKDELFEAFEKLEAVCAEALRKRRKLLFFGNGGSAADAQHIATELTVRFQANRKAFPAIALTTDTSALTAIGNDFGFDYIFSRQVEALCSPGDVAIGISTSGNSENVICGLTAAKSIGATTVAMCGGDGGRMKDSADLIIIVPSKVTARIQEMHIMLGHMLCGALEREVEAL
jgi:D-sedoheptulose 7-phosphate isomerase